MLQNRCFQYHIWLLNNPVQNFLLKHEKIYFV